jgi:hypothetical protein
MKGYSSLYLLFKSNDGTGGYFFGVTILEVVQINIVYNGF